LAWLLNFFSSDGFREPGRVCRNHELDIPWLGIRLSAAKMLPKSANGFAHPGCILGEIRYDGA
jgi:hypothetical protein